MATVPRILDDTKREQARVFRIALDPTRYGLTLKAISMDAQIGYDSLRNYASGDTEMPLSALRRLVGVIPDELLSLLLPESRLIVRVPESLDYDEIEAACRDFLATKGKAHHPDSPAKRDLSECEKDALNEKVTVLRAVA